MGVPHIVLGLLAVFFAYDSQQNVTHAASDLAYGDGEPHHITVPVHTGATSPAPQPVPPPAPPDAPSATSQPFSIGGGPSPPPVRYRSAGGNTVQLALVVVVLRLGKSEQPSFQLHLDQMDQSRKSGGSRQRRAVR